MPLITGRGAAILGAALPFPGAALGADFANGIYQLGSQHYSSFLAIPGASVTRASAKYAQTSLGTFVSFASGTPAITDQGVLIEESRTNSVLNSTMAGAVVGTPGTRPTNWGGFTTVGLSSQIVGIGQEFGLTYIDLRFFGTATGGDIRVPVMPTRTLAASAGQVWTQSAFYRLVAGSAANVTGAYLNQVFRDSTGSAITGGTGGTAALSAAFARYTNTATAPATTATADPELRVTTVAGAVDFTLRIYAPQQELGAFATSPIDTTGSAAATRAADSVTLTYAPNGSSGTATYGTNSVASVSPTSPINLGSTSGGAWVNTYLKKLVVAK